MKKDIRTLNFGAIAGWRGDSMVCPQAFGGDVYAGCSMGCWWCLVAGTPIKMADGSEKPIEQIQPGDVVVTLNEKTSKAESKPVLRNMSRMEKVMKIRVNGIEMRITDNHEVFTQRGWVSAGKLRVGDSVLKIKD